MKAKRKISIHPSNLQFSNQPWLTPDLRGGTAPPSELRSKKKFPNRNPDLNSKCIQPPRRHYMFTKKLQTPKRPIKSHDKQEWEQDLLQSLIPSRLQDRPPCRQNQNLFDLQDPVCLPQKIQNTHINHTPKEFERPVRVLNNQRPPSRHKTPPKALGLDLPPNNYGLQQYQPTSREDQLANTVPVNLKEGSGQKRRGSCKDNFRGTRSSMNSKSYRLASSKMRTQSAKKGASELGLSMNSGSARKNPMHVPITINPTSRQIKSREAKINTGILLKNPRNRTSQGGRQGKAQLPFFSSLEPAFLNLFG